MAVSELSFVTLALVTAASLSPAAASCACAPQCRCVLNIMACLGMGLTELPSGHWPSVMFLDVSSNVIDHLDVSDLGQRFPSLNFLRMRHNALTHLDLNAVAGPTAPNRLLMADLTGNRISHVTPPAPGARLNQFSTLFLSSNRIASLDRDTFKQLPSLRQLALNDNPLVIPPAQPFLSHHLINELDLSDVDASALSEDTFAELPLLVVLSLERSGVQKVNGVFKNPLALDTLYLQSNAITDITDIVPADRKLKLLSLDRNPLERIDTKVLPIEDGGELAIQDTPLACGCAYADVARWAVDHRVKLYAACDNETNCAFDKVE